MSISPTTLISLWDKARPALQEALGNTTYETWFSAIHITEDSANTLIIETPDEFFKNWIVEHYLSTIQSVIQPFSKETIIIDVRVNTERSPHTLRSSQGSPQVTQHPPEIVIKNEGSNLNSRFTFDNFVIGPSNRFCYAACQAVAESPARAYNPLFIYGKVGLGKTHLMQAIAMQIKHNHPSIKYCYISSERFTNELIEAIRYRSTTQFRQKYRNIDVLLIDDIHFIAGKESTQEEFFHTFNTLHNNRKQIIISSDRSPKEIANLEERLSSRFAWGLITDIQPPDFETRVAILRKKIEHEPIKVPDAVITFIAEQIKTNIRELEGALIRVVAYSLLEDKPLSFDMAKIVLKDMVIESIKIITVENIQQSVAEFFKLSPRDLKAKNRSKNILRPRQVAMYLTRQLTNLSLPQIGGAFGGKDHTTILHSCKKIEQDLLKDIELRNIIEKLSTVLKQ